MAQNARSPWEKRHQQWLDFVLKIADAFQAGRAIPLGPSSTPLVAPTPFSTSVRSTTILVASPHPDDEALISALPLRLRIETGARVVNCAVTLGSDLSQRARRRAELESSCCALGFDLIVPGDEGLDDVKPQSRQSHPASWQEKVETLRILFDRERPDAVFAPHEEDFNTTHVGTHYLVVDALVAHLAHSHRPPVLLIETEYWHPHSNPNLMVGVTPETLAIQMMATAEHAGEVSRNPYHLGLPARMMDNVRRGSEVVGGQGAPAKPFMFAELYRVTRMSAQGEVPPQRGGLIVAPDGELRLSDLENWYWPSAAGDSGLTPQNDGGKLV